MRTKKKVLLITLLVILASLVVVYGRGRTVLFVSFLSEHAASTMRISPIRQIPRSSIRSKLKCRGISSPSREMTTSRTSLQRKSTSLLILKRQSGCVRGAKCLAVAIEVFGSHDVSHVIDASFDHDKVVEILTPTVETYNKEATPSADATIAYDEAHQSRSGKR